MPHGARLASTDRRSTGQAFSPHLRSGSPKTSTVKSRRPVAGPRPRKGVFSLIRPLSLGRPRPSKVAKRMLVKLREARGRHKTIRCRCRDRHGLAAADAFGEPAEDAAYQVANVTEVNVRCRTLLHGLPQLVAGTPEGTEFVATKPFVVSITFSEGWAPFVRKRIGSASLFCRKLDLDERCAQRLS